MKTLAQVRSSLPSECARISPFKSWATLARILVLLSGCVYAETQLSSVFWLVPLWFIHGQVLVGLFVLGHDCGHRSFSTHRLTNLVVGHLAFSPLGNGLMNWSKTHNHHHAHTQLRGQDVDWSKWLMTKEEFARTSWRENFAGKLGYALPFGVFFWVWLNAIQRGLARQERSIVLSNLLMWSVMALIYGGLWWFTGVWGLLKYQAIPATIAMFTGYFLLTIQHANEVSRWYTDESWTPLKGQMEATFDVRFPRVFEWLWLDINIHIPHHIAPNVPWYRLRQARNILKSAHPELYQERDFSFREISWMVRTPFVNYDPSERSFTLCKETP